MDNKFRKEFANIETEINEGKREVISYISTEHVDRDKEVVLTKGLIKKNYQNSPVVFYNHNLEGLPIGKSLWIKSGYTKDGIPALIAKTYISDKTQDARDVFGLIQDGVLTSWSITGMIKKASSPTNDELKLYKGAENIVREYELLEYSVVGIPANTEALTLAVSKGYTGKIIDLLKKEIKIEKPEEVKKVEECIEDIKKSNEELNINDIMIRVLGRITNKM
jgi:hypothetical protein